MLWLRTTTTDQTAQAARVTEAIFQRNNITGVCNRHTCSLTAQQNKSGRRNSRALLLHNRGVRLALIQGRGALACIRLDHRRIYDPLLWPNCSMIPELSAPRAPPSSSTPDKSRAFCCPTQANHLMTSPRLEVLFQSHGYGYLGL